MVGLTFFSFLLKKTVNWLTYVESSSMRKLSKVPGLEIALVLFTLYLISSSLSVEDSTVFLTAGILGILTFVVIQAISELLERAEEKKRAAGLVVKVVRQVFSVPRGTRRKLCFDGVIRAFALFNNIIVIALGLSVGAIFVRSI